MKTLIAAAAAVLLLISSRMPWSVWHNIAGEPTREYGGPAMIPLALVAVVIPIAALAFGRPKLTGFVIIPGAVAGVLVAGHLLNALSHAGTPDFAHQIQIGGVLAGVACVGIVVAGIVAAAT